MGQIISRFINATTNNIDVANSLNEKINLINQNVQYNINLTWTILGVAITIAGIALFTLSKVWVNKRVDEELPKVVKANPPIFYYNGKLVKAWESYNEEIKYNSMGIISIDCKKLNIINLDFPIELKLFHVKQEQVSVMDFSKSGYAKEVKNIIKTPILEYKADIKSDSIQIMYERPINDQDPIIEWTLKIPNPKYNHDTSQ